MSVTRRAVLVALARESDAASEETTSSASLAAALDVEEGSILTHLDALVACELAHRDADGDVRVTVTGEELLALDVDDGVVVAPPTERDERFQA